MGALSLQERIASDVERRALGRHPENTPPIDRSGRAERVLALQRTAGNAAVVQLLGAERSSVQRACCSDCAAGHRCQSEDEDHDVQARGHRALRASVAARKAAPAVDGRVLARYAHQNCTEDDLKKHIWPADYLARQMVKKAIKALSASQIEANVAALFPKYFMTASPKVAKILHVLDKVDIAFRDNDYTYECEEECRGDDNGYTWPGIVGSITSSHIHICMKRFRSRTNECLARTIIHEFTHRYCDTDDEGYCKVGCEYSECPTELTPEDALDNADSYACFAYELWAMKLLTASAEPALQEDEPATAVV